MPDKFIFKTNWIGIKETEKGFQYAVRKGVNSIAVFLIRMNIRKGWEVLVRYQPLCIQNNDDSLFPCPITGSIDIGERTPDTAIREVEEESGFVLEKVEYLGKYIVGTQTNEIVDMFHANVTSVNPEKVRGDGTYHESISYNQWEPLENLKDYDYSACQIGYYKLKEIYK